MGSSQQMIAAYMAASGGGASNFSDNFNTDPAARWTNLYGSYTWTGIAIQPNAGGCWSVYVTASSGTSQYGKLTQVNGRGAIVFRSTGVGSSGFYTIESDPDGNVYFNRTNNSGFIAVVSSGALAFANGDTMSVTIEGTNTGTTVRIWKNTSNNTPATVSGWDSGGDTADLTLTAAGGTAAYYDSGLYVGIGASAQVDLDNWFGGNL